MALDNLIDGYGWILPALMLSALLLVLIGLFAYWFEDLPLEAFEGFGGIYRWTRQAWQGQRGQASRKSGTLRLLEDEGRHD
jgi:amino acid transporter